MMSRAQRLMLIHILDELQKPRIIQQIIQPYRGGGGLTSAVTSLSKSGSTKLINDVTLSEGSNVTLTQAGQNIEIASAGGGAGGDHNILSATHLDSLVASVVRGDIIVGNSTPKWARLPIGLINYLLKSDGTDITWGLIVNANIDATAAIVESKLALNYPTHAEVHTLTSHSTKAHSELTDVTADQHHAQSHTLTSHSTKAHAELTDVTADQHHARLHALGSASDHSGTGTIKTTLSFAVTGTLTTGNDKAPTILAPCSLTITKVKLVVKTAPTGAAIIVDVNKNGTTIFTTQASRPQIAIGATTGDSGTPDVTTLAETDKLTIDIDQVGSTVAGADLTVEVVTEQSVVFS